MTPSIGLNLRVTGYCNQGGRKYMEDVFSVAYQQTEDEKDLEYAFFGIFDGHGGREAAVFAKEHLMDFIVRQKSFWAEDDDSVLRAIHEGYMQTHQAMWKELDKWPRTASGLPSTAGTTASIAFIRRGKIYIGHVGDSAIVLGVQDPLNPEVWCCDPLTRDHKPESTEEHRRIHLSGGKVICKSGVPRVVWNRPKVGHKGPVRRSTHIDEIPFLAVARSLGDLWSYNSEEDVFVVSPEPDTHVYPIDILRHRCLVLATDGAWNMLSPSQAVALVCQAEMSNEKHTLNPNPSRQWVNPSKRLVDSAIEKWNVHNLRADNTSVVTVMLDPPGPPRAQLLKRQREMALLNREYYDNSTRCTETVTSDTTTSGVASSKQGVSIISRFPNSRNIDDARGHNLTPVISATALSQKASSLIHEFRSGGRVPVRVTESPVSRRASSPADSSSESPSPIRASESGVQNHSLTDNDMDDDCDIQCNEISSSDDDPTPVKVSPALVPSTLSFSAPCSLRSSKKASKVHRVLRESPRLTNGKESSATRQSQRPLRLKRLTAIKPRHTALSSATVPLRLSQIRQALGEENEQQRVNQPLLIHRWKLRSDDDENIGKSATSNAKKNSMGAVETRCNQLNSRIRSMERKVAGKTQQLDQEVKSLSKLAPKVRCLRSSMVETPRSLRLRNSAASSSNRTAKSSSIYPSTLRSGSHHRGGVATIDEVKPIFTRSRRAKVLRLRK